MLFQRRPAPESIFTGDYKLGFPQRQGVCADLCFGCIDQTGQMIFYAGTGGYFTGAMRLAQFLRLQFELGEIETWGSSHSYLLSHSARCPHRSGGKKSRMT